MATSSKSSKSSLPSYASALDLSGIDFRNRVILLTGGGGYVGRRLAGALLRTNAKSICMVDVKFGSDAYPESNESDRSRIILKEVDITDKKAVTSVIQTILPHIVFHLASFGMSGLESLNRQRIINVNVEGTKNILAACRECGVSVLVYTSTYNVVFGGQEIHNGDEGLPYFPLNKHPDNYSRTKAIAEDLVLTANGQEWAVSRASATSILRTCALRSAGIYGEGELRHLPRVVSYLQKGLIVFVYGNAIVDFIYVDNLILAHLLAAHKLCQDEEREFNLSLEQPKLPHPSSSQSRGEAYFISDEEPILNFTFFGLLFEGLGYKIPKLKIPVFILFYLAFFMEILQNILGKFGIRFSAILTRAEVFKSGITHYFNIAKAKRELGYRPQVKTKEGMRRVVEWFVANGFHKNQTSQKNKTYGSKAR